MTRSGRRRRRRNVSAGNNRSKSSSASRRGGSDDDSAGTAATADDGENDWPILATYLLALPDPLPVPHGSTWLQQVDESEPLLAGMEAIPFQDARGTIAVGGTNFVSLKFWQLRDDNTKAPETHFQSVLLTRVMASLMGSGKALPSDTSGAQALDGIRTVVEAVTFVASGDDMVAHDDKSEPLSRCIEVLLNYHRAYRLATRKHVPALTYERLPWLVPWTSRAVETDSNHRPQGFIVLENRNFQAPDVEPLPPDQYEALAQFYARDAAGDPFAIYSERSLEAEIELWTTGQVGRSAIETAVAAEVLFDGVLGMLLWEESLRAECDTDTAATIFSSDVTPRLRHQYSTRLGGDWSFNNPPMKGWFSDIAGLRNRVVHAGYRPSKHEAADALERLHDIERFIGDRLSVRWRQYPRTAWAFLGTQGFERRSSSKSANRWFADHGGRVDPWIREYVSWREAVNEAVARRRSAA